RTGWWSSRRRRRSPGRSTGCPEMRRSWSGWARPAARPCSPPFRTGRASWRSSWAEVGAVAKVLVVPNDPPSPSWEAVADGFSGQHEVRVAGTDHPRLQEYLEWTDLPVFHVDDNAGRSGAVYRLAVGHPGLVTLHDLDLEELVRSLVREGDPFAEAALREAGADRARLSG